VQMTDPVLCGRILEAHEWNLEAAVHTALGMGDMGAALDEGQPRLPLFHKTGSATDDTPGHTIESK
jgi:hypothetical protein